jgi:hypothetical protein
MGEMGMDAPEPAGLYRAADLAAPGNVSRNVFREPQGAERFALGVTGGDVAETGLPRLKRLMGGLARMMHGAADRADEDGGDNPELPAGYTYLLQFIGHDLVASGAPAWAVGAAATEQRDLRPARLRLDTLYGMGPDICPFVYEARSAPQAGLGQAPMRGPERLRLGRLRPERTAGCSAGPMLDVPRGGEPIKAGRPWNRPDVLLADARNDANGILSQMTVLFSALHNAILARIADEPPAAGAAPRMSTRFARAREATTLLYRHVIREDLLPRLLLPEVLSHYRHLGAEDFLDQRGRDSGLPPELSHGVFRVGHAMVRSEYRLHGASRQPLSGLLTHTSLSRPDAMPPSGDWAVCWRHFFPMPSHPPPTPSRRLRPCYAGDLQLERRFGAIDETGTIGLAYRDLMSAATAGLWSVAGLYAVLRAEGGDPVGHRALADDHWRTERVRDWLARRAGASRLSGEDCDSIAQDPPLSFYILFEAEEEAAGMRLGLLGSVLLAEALFGAMRRDPLPAERVHETLAGQLHWLSPALTGSDPNAGGLERVRSMSDLVAIAAGASDLTSGEPSFL